MQANNRKRPRKLARDNVHHRPCRACLGTGLERDHAALGTALRERRKQAGLSLREVAQRMDLSAPYVSDIERGHRRWSDKLIARFCAAINDKTMLAYGLLNGS